MYSYLIIDKNYILLVFLCDKTFNKLIIICYNNKKDGSDEYENCNITI